MNELRITDADSPFVANSTLTLQAYGRHAVGFVRTRVSAFTSNTSGKVYISISDHSIAIQLVGTFTATIQFEGSVDGANWAALSMTPIGGGAAVTSATAAGIWFNIY
jgi:hypothetical protein